MQVPVRIRSPLTLAAGATVVFYVEDLMQGSPLLEPALLLCNTGIKSDGTASPADFTAQLDLVLELGDTSDPMNSGSFTFPVVAATQVDNGRLLLLDVNARTARAIQSAADAAAHAASFTVKHKVTLVNLDGANNVIVQRLLTGVFEQFIDGEKLKLMDIVR